MLGLGLGFNLVFVFNIENLLGFASKACGFGILAERVNTDMMQNTPFIVIIVRVHWLLGTRVVATKALVLRRPLLLPLPQTNNRNTDNMIHNSCHLYLSYTWHYARGRFLLVRDVRQRCAQRQRNSGAGRR